MPDILLDTKSYADCTIGRLFIAAGGFSCFTLELPWLDNAGGVSCIPAGIYSYKKRMSPGKGYTVIELIDVPERTFIQIHLGNFTSQILGCIIPGTAIKDVNADGIPDVVDSEKAFNKLMCAAPDKGTIEIRRSF